jgi:hypothetical protein
MLFGKDSHLQSVTVHINGELVERKKCFQFLGLTVDENMSWDEHANLLLGRISSYVYLLKNLSEFIPNWTLLRIYNSHINSRLTYGIGIWGSMLSQKYLDKLQVKQNICIRAIDHNVHGQLHTSDLFDLYGILNVKQLIIHDQLKFGYALRNALLPVPVLELFTYGSDLHHYMTRARYDPLIQSHKTQKYNKSFLTQVPKTLASHKNIIPTSISFGLFKKQSKCYLFENIKNLI